MKFGGPCTPFIPKPLAVRKDNTTKCIQCPVWISNAALSTFSPSIISNQTKNQFGNPEGKLSTTLQGRTTPDLIAWEHAPEPGSEEALQRVPLRPRKLFGPVRTRSDEAETRSTTFRSMVPPVQRNLAVPDVLAELSVPNNRTRLNCLAWQQRPSMHRVKPIHRQRFIRRVPSPVVPYQDIAPTWSTYPELLSMQDCPAKSFEGELRRGDVSSSSPYDLAQRLDRALRALVPPKWNGARTGVEKPHYISIYKYGNNNRRTPRTLGNRLGMAVREMKSHLNTDYLASSRENNPLICGGDATSKFNSIPPMNSRISRRSYCEACRERDIGTPWNTRMTPSSLYDPIEMINSINLCVSDLKPPEAPISETQRMRDVPQPSTLLQSDRFRKPLATRRHRVATRTDEDRQARPRDTRSPTLLGRRLGQALRNLEIPEMAQSTTAPRKVRDRAVACRDDDFRPPLSTERPWKPPQGRFFASKLSVCLPRLPLRFDKAVQVGLAPQHDLRAVTRRDFQKGDRRKKMAPNAARSPKKTLQIVSPFGANDQGRRNRQSPRRRNPSKQSPKRSPIKASSRVKNARKNTTYSNAEIFFRTSVESPCASSSDERLLRSPVSNSSARSIFSIQKVQDMISLPKGKKYYDRERREHHHACSMEYLRRPSSRHLTPRSRILH